MARASYSNSAFASVGQTAPGIQSGDTSNVGCPRKRRQACESPPDPPPILSPRPHRCQCAAEQRGRPAAQRKSVEKANPTWTARVFRSRRSVHCGRPAQGFRAPRSASGPTRSDRNPPAWIRMWVRGPTTDSPGCGGLNRHLEETIVRQVATTSGRIVGESERPRTGSRLPIGCWSTTITSVFSGAPIKKYFGSPVDDPTLTTPLGVPGAPVFPQLSGRFGQTHRAKYAEAFRKISFARFNSRTSRSSSLRRWRARRSSGRFGGRCRARPAALHRRSVSGVHPSLLAMEPIAAVRRGGRDGEDAG